MKRSTFHKLLWLLVAAPFLLAACDDDAPYYGKGIDSEYNLLYSSRTDKYPSAGTLDLTYNDVSLAGKDMYVNLMSQNSAEVKFFGLFAGEPEVVLEVGLSKSADGYSIGRTSMSTPGGTSFTISGKLQKDNGKPSMVLDISDVKIPANTLTSVGKLKTFPAVVRDQIMEFDEDFNVKVIIPYELNLLWEWLVKVDPINEGEERYENLLQMGDMDATPALQTLLSNLLFLAIDELQFHADGEITAVYHRFDNPETSLMGAGATEADRGTREVSPKGLINYYVNSEGIVYIKPNLEMILNLVASNQAKETRADGGLNIAQLLPLILNMITIYPEFDVILNRGVAFRFEANDPAEKIPWLNDDMNMLFSTYRGDYRLYMDSGLFAENGKSAVYTSIIKSIPAIWNLLEIELPIVEDIPMLGTIDLNDFIDLIAGRIVNSTSTKVGLYLERAQ